MAVEIVHFLMGKFTEGLEVDDGTAILLNHRFLELKWELEDKISSTMPLNTTNLLRELLYDLNDILTECRTLSTRRSVNGRPIQCLGCHSLRESWFCYRTKKRLRTIKQRIRAISKEGEGGLASGSINTTAARDGEETGKGKAVEFDRWTSPDVDMSTVHGLREQALAMEELLIEQVGSRGFRALGIVGMGGVGKTTLAKVVFNSHHVKRHFRPRLWVCMSQTVEKGKDARKETLERMLMSLGVEEEVIYSVTDDGTSGPQTLALLAFMLHRQLRGKRYLIVFDDMWSTDEWYGGSDSGPPRDDEWGDRLAYGLPRGDGGGVIVTGRSDAAVKGMVGEEGDTRLLSPLDSREACWSIFMDAYVKRGRAVEDPGTVMAMNGEITDKCRGLPLAARTMGEIMSEMILFSGTSSGSGSDESNNTSTTTSGSLE